MSPAMALRCGDGHSPCFLTKALQRRLSHSGSRDEEMVDSAEHLRETLWRGDFGLILKGTKACQMDKRKSAPGWGSGVRKYLMNAVNTRVR